jgi:hypothetical protein
MKNLILIIITLLSTQITRAATSGSLDYDGYTSTNRASVEEDTNIFDETRFHGGVGLLQSYQDVNVGNGKRERGGIRGFELNVGVDLFSPSWIAQGILTFLPENALGESSLSSNAFELRIIYEKPIFYGVTLHGGVGLANRFYDIKTKGLPDHTFYSGASVLVLGADYWPSGDVSAGVEVSNHLPIANGDDPTSVDMGIKLSGHF